MSEFEIFVEMYVAYQMRRHAGNPYWDTEEKTIENLGGIEQIEGVYSLFDYASDETCRKFCGFTKDELLKRYEMEVMA